MLHVFIQNDYLTKLTILIFHHRLVNILLLKLECMYETVYYFSL